MFTFNRIICPDEGHHGLLQKVTGAAILQVKLLPDMDWLQVLTTPTSNDLASRLTFWKYFFTWENILNSPPTEYKSPFASSSPCKWRSFSPNSGLDRFMFENHLGQIKNIILCFGNNSSSISSEGNLIHPSYKPAKSEILRNSKIMARFLQKLGPVLHTKLKVCCLHPLEP